MVFGYPYMVICEQRTICLYTPWVSEQFLRRRRRKFVTDGILRNGVFDVRVHDFEDTVMLRRRIKAGGAMHNRFPHLVKVTVGICRGVPGRGM